MVSTDGQLMLDVKEPATGLRFDLLLQRYRTSLVTSLYAWLRNREQREDLAQGLFCACTGPGRLRTEREVHHLLFRNRNKPPLNSSGQPVPRF